MFSAWAPIPTISKLAAVARFFRFAKHIRKLYSTGSSSVPMGIREAEARRAATLVRRHSHAGPVLKTFPDGFMPFVGAEVKAVFEELKQSVSPGPCPLSMAQGCASGSQADSRIDLEYLSQPPDSRIRDSQV